ncbi:MAG: aspartyl protease family protein, partial [Candidatus Melainabacteria bacterium]|nr:aspartyl protease family protein [Candidatus Melainabacteria bacterium]
MFMKTTRSLACTKQRVWLLFIVLSSLLLATLPAFSLEGISAQSVGLSRTGNAKDIAASIVAAYGGLEKLMAVKEQPFSSRGNVTVTSTVSQASNSFECDIFGKADKLRIETTVMGQPMILGFDGKNCWTQFGDWVSPSTETTAKHLAEELRHGLNLLLKISDANCKLQVVGKKLCQGKMCDVLNVLAEDGKTTTFYADEASHLVLRSEYMGTDSERGIPAIQAMEYENYQSVAGTPTAFKTTEYSLAKKTSQTLLSKMELGVLLDEKIFEMPAESEVAQVKTSSVTVPFEYIGNAILVKVRLNGTTDYKFIVDTGASQTVLDKAVASSMGPYSSSSLSITAGSKAIPLSYTTLQSLSVGDVVLNNIPALVSDLSAFVKTLGERPAGLIGANILRRFLVTIDFADKKIVLSNPKNPILPPNSTVIPTFPGFGSTAL